MPLLEVTMAEGAVRRGYSASRLTTHDQSSAHLFVTRWMFSVPSRAVRGHFRQ
jgi:hypothetical protein